MRRDVYMLICFLIVSCLTTTLHGADETVETNKTEEMSAKGNPMVLIKTGMGDIKVELNPEKAPITVKNFLEYVDAGFYNDTIFHRIIQTFMVQGGGFTEDMQQKPVRAPIKNEADNGLKNERGTIAMARTFVVDSATAQFFINVVDNAFLDHKDKTDQGFGYCVFAKITEGLDTVDKIKAVKTGRKGGHGDVPIDVVKMIEVKRID